MADVTPKGLDFDNPVFKSFCFYMTICIFKMLFMGFLTIVQRIRKGVSKRELIKSIVHVSW